MPAPIENNLIIGAVGHFIGAVLETAGFYTHSQILNQFTGLITTMGAFIFTWYLMGGIISVALFGNYKKAFYFLVAPGLFYFMLMNTTEVKGVAHQFGEAVHDADGEKLMAALKGSESLGIIDAAQVSALSRYEDSARVSTFVVIYDRLISDVIQQLVAFLVSTKNNDYLINLMRENTLRRVAKTRVEDQQYIKLASMLTFGACANQMYLNYRLGTPPLSNAEADTAEEFMRQDLQKLVNELELEVFHVPDDVRGYIDSQTGTTAAENATCKQIWEHLRVITLKLANATLDPTDAEKAAHPEITDIQWGAVKTDIVNKLNDTNAPQNDILRASQVLGAFMLRNTMAYTSHNAMVTQMAGRGDWDRHVFQAGFGEYQTAVSAAERLKIIWIASFIPYLQGVLLYILACAFPFFTLFLLVPSRITSFFIWMSLWLWVKSWDVGFAVVHFVRKVFWNLMPHMEDARTASNWDQIQWDVNEASVFHVMFNSDPTFHHNTYYLIVGLFTVAVPLVTAHLCLGATNFWDALKTGIDQAANSFANDHEKKGRAALADAHHRKFGVEMMLAKGYGAQEGEIAGRKEGLMQADGTVKGNMDRRWDGGQALSRFARGRASKAAFRHAFNDPSVTRRLGITGAHAGRRDSRARKLAGGVIDANLNRLAENYNTTGNVGDMARSGNNAWWAMSGTYRDEGENLARSREDMSIVGGGEDNSGEPD